MNNNEVNLIELIDKLTPINNEWRITTNAIKKIELMWFMGKEVDIFLNNNDYGFDNLLRTLYDPHGKKMTYITRDLLSYSRRIYLNFETIEDIKTKLKGLNSYTLFREAFPLLTNKKYKLSCDEKDNVIEMITNVSSIKTIQKKLIEKKQSIRPIKNSRVTKAKQYSEVSRWLIILKTTIINYFKDNKDLNIDKLPIKYELISDLKIILLDIAMNKEFDVSNLNKDYDMDKNITALIKIAMSNNESKARFKKWGLSSSDLMLMAEMLNAILKPNNYYFVRQKILK